MMPGLRRDDFDFSFRKREHVGDVSRAVGSQGVVIPLIVANRWHDETSPVDIIPKHMSRRSYVMCFNGDRYTHLAAEMRWLGS